MGGHCGRCECVLVCVCVCVANIGGGSPEASHLMTRSSTLKMVTDSGCVVIAGGILTARKQTKIKLLKSSIL